MVNWAVFKKTAWSKKARSGTGAGRRNQLLSGNDYSLVVLSALFVAGKSPKCATHAAAVKRTTSFASSSAAAMLGSSEGSPRCAIASNAAALTCQFLSVVAFTSAFAVPGSGSWASCFAAAARTGEESFFATDLKAS